MVLIEQAQEFELNLMIKNDVSIINKANTYIHDIISEGLQQVTP